MKKIIILLSVALAIMCVGCAVPKTECVSSEDCLGRPHDPCEGSWACKSSICVWYCNPPTTLPPTTCSVVTTVTAATTTTEPLVTLDPSIEQLIRKDQGTNKALVRPLLTKGNPGDKVAFGLGIYNIYRESTVFEVRVTYLKAYDKTSSKINIENPSTDDWILESSKKVTIPSESLAIVPLGFVIGYMIDDTKPTIPGTYTFKIKVYEVTGTSLRDYVETQADILVS